METRWIYEQVKKILHQKAKVFTRMYPTTLVARIISEL